MIGFPNFSYPSFPNSPMGLAQPLGYAKPEEKGVDGQIVRGGIWCPHIFHPGLPKFLDEGPLKSELIKKGPPDSAHQAPWFTSLGNFGLHHQKHSYIQFSTGGGKRLTPTTQWDEGRKIHLPCYHHQPPTCLLTSPRLHPCPLLKIGEPPTIPQLLLSHAHGPEGTPWVQFRKETG